MKYTGENKNIKFSPNCVNISQLRTSILAAAYMGNIFTQTFEKIYPRLACMIFYVLVVFHIVIHNN